MFALVLLTLFASMTAATAAVLADSALRWWSEEQQQSGGGELGAALRVPPLHGVAGVVLLALCAAERTAGGSWHNDPRREKVG